MKTKPVVVITGSSAGLGRAIAHAFAKRGAQVGLIARNSGALDAARQECMERGGNAHWVSADVSDPDAVERAAAEIEERLGPINIWVNNAMVSVFSPVKDMEPADYRRVTDVLYLGYVWGTLAALRRMLPRDRGTIVQVGSALAYRSIPLQSAYCAAKHAINGFTDSLRCELYHDKSNVRLTAVHMPAMNTMQFEWVKSRLPNQAQPVPPIFEPDVAAKAVVAAGTARNPRREYWVGFSTVKAIAAQRIVPGLLDRYLGKTGYESQQVKGEPRDPNAPDNLRHFVPGRHRARGRFDDRAKDSSAEVSFSLHRGGWALAALAAGGVGLAVSLAGNGRRRH
jgi:NAD(P)-dependent dehydrogenase (short-subunit alcohol dehydrogenase family)